MTNSELNEAEIQLLIALAELADPIETPNNIGYTFFPQSLEEAGTYFRRFRQPWQDAQSSLSARGLITAAPLQLTDAGLAVARSLRLARPPIYYWYRDFYLRTAHSPANAEFCQRVYGRDLCQQGFMDMQQLDLAVQQTAIGPGCRVLDLGCGAGQIAEYISDQTGARVWGLDYIPEAIELAQARTASKRARLAFRVGSLDRLDYPPASFDVLLAFDTLYMPVNLLDTLRQMRALLAPGGRMAALYSNDYPGLSGQVLDASCGPLGAALRELGLPYTAVDLTAADARHALVKQAVVEDLRPAFAAEGQDFLSDLRAAEAQGVLGAVAAGFHTRYLYRIG